VAASPDTSGGFGNERICGAGSSRSQHHDGPFDELKLSDVQNYTEPISYGVTTTADQWLPRLSLRTASGWQRPHTDLACATSADTDRRERRFAPRSVSLHPAAIAHRDSPA